MPLVPAKCPECGGNINIDPAKKAGICEYCKQPFVVEEAIQNFNTTYNITNNNEIKADVVNVYENKEKDFVIKAGELVEYKGESSEVIIPDGVDSIGFRAFLNSNIKSIIIPKSVNRIKERAFEYCKELKTIIFQCEKVEAKRDIFKGCNSIESIEQNGNKFLNVESWENYRRSDFTEAVYCYAVKGNMSLFPTQNDSNNSTIYVPEGVVKIVQEYEKPINPSLAKEVVLPESVVEIADYAFYEKSCLKKFNLTDNIIKIGICSFAKSGLLEINIPGSIKTISRAAFSGCKSLRKVNVNIGVENIGAGTFSSCMSSVSYTHLDVYKRQSLDTTSFPLNRY